MKLGIEIYDWATTVPAAVAAVLVALVIKARKNK